HHRATLPRGLDPVPGDRASWRRVGCTRDRDDPEQSYRRARRAGGRGGSAQRRDHWDQRFPRPRRGAGLGARCAAGGVAACPRAAAPAFEPLPCIRLAEPFEALRDASDRMLARTGRRPKIFLANLGRPAEFSARAAFAKNFFTAGGIETTSSDGFADVGDMIEAYKASGAKLACLCSSDEVYAREASAAARALRHRGALVWLAGQPGALELEFMQAGVSAFVFPGCDALAALRALHAVIDG